MTAAIATTKTDSWKIAWAEGEAGAKMVVGLKVHSPGWRTIVPMANRECPAAVRCASPIEPFARAVPRPHGIAAARQDGRGGAPAPCRCPTDRECAANLSAN